MKYYLVKMVTNTQGQDGSSISVYDSKEKALVVYHQTLANFINADDVYFATVEILNERGNIEALEIVDHIPEPEPEPAPEPEPEPEESVEE